MLIIYTDGSSLGNPGPGGWAAVIKDDNNNITELSGGFKYTTNNRMELLGVIESLKFAEKNNEKEITIMTDSQLICNAINKGWLDKWQKVNWKKSDGKKVLNIDLWEKLVQLLKNKNVTFNWIAGHSGIAGNERCDTLCKIAAEKATDIDFNYVENSVEKESNMPNNQNIFATATKIVKSKCKNYEMRVLEQNILIYDNKGNKIMEFLNEI